MAKKLTFQQIQRNSSAIQPYEGTSAARADVVNRVRDQLLAGACFSLDKNGGIRRCHTFDLFEHLFQSRTVAYDLLESALIRKLLTTLDSLESSHRGPPGYAHWLRGSTVQSGSNILEQDFIVERFCHELYCARSQCLQAHFCVAVCRDEDGRNPAVLSVELGLQFQTGHSRHANIRDQACSLVLLAGLQELLRRRKRSRRQSNRLQQALQCPAHQLIVIDNRDQFRLRLSSHSCTVTPRQGPRNYALV